MSLEERFNRGMAFLLHLTREDVSLLKELFTSKQLIEGYAYFHKKHPGGVTTRELQSALKLPESTAYRIVKILREKDLIESNSTTRTHRHGPGTDIWGLKM